MLGKRTSLIVAAGAIVALALPATAPAKIVVDPDGPAAKQYSALLDRARDRASGVESSAGVPGSTEVPAPFGRGIEPGEAHRAGKQGGARDRRGDPAASIGPTGSATLTLAGLSFAVLGFGALLGFAMRRAEPAG